MIVISLLPICFSVLMFLLICVFECLWSFFMYVLLLYLDKDMCLIVFGFLVLQFIIERHLMLFELYSDPSMCLWIVFFWKHNFMVVTILSRQLVVFCCKIKIAMCNRFNCALAKFKENKDNFNLVMSNVSKILVQMGWYHAFWIISNSYKCLCKSLLHTSHSRKKVLHAKKKVLKKICKNMCFLSSNWWIYM